MSESEKDSKDTPDTSTRNLIVGGVVGWIIILISLAYFSQWIDKGI